VTNIWTPTATDAAAYEAHETCTDNVDSNDPPDCSQIIPDFFASQTGCTGLCNVAFLELLIAANVRRYSHALKHASCAASQTANCRPFCMTSCIITRAQGSALHACVCVCACAPLCALMRAFVRVWVGGDTREDSCLMHGNLLRYAKNRFLHLCSPQVIRGSTHLPGIYAVAQINITHPKGDVDKSSASSNCDLHMRPFRPSTAYLTGPEKVDVAGVLASDNGSRMWQRELRHWHCGSPFWCDRRHCFPLHHDICCRSSSDLIPHSSRRHALSSHPLP
jgi:hypothetical protein